MAAVAQTPPRPVPGIWPQTPAAGLISSQQPLFQTSLAQARRPSQLAHSASSTSIIQSRPSDQLPAIAPQASVEVLSPAERAARTVNDALSSENKFPELDVYLSPGYSSEYDIQSSPTWAPFEKVRVHNIPDQIFEQYNRAQVSTSMGLFAQLRHAWVTIDNALYMWDYTIGNPELLGFEGQPHSITSVGLAVPRVGVFLPSIKHVIVLATISDVTLLGLGVDPAPGGSTALSLFQTGMSVSVKGLQVSAIASSAKTGRIFFGGRTDNDIYEITYQQEERWFSSRCAKVCHTASTTKSLGLSFAFGGGQQEHVEQMIIDDSRDLLYTLSSVSSIRVFHLKPDGSLSLLITKTSNEIYANIGHIIIQNDALNPRVKIISISAIPAHEASRYHLVATTTTGYRIYLSATSSGYWSTNRVGAPISMQAQHVKTPPLTMAPPMSSPSQAQLSGNPHDNVHQPIRNLTMTRLAQRFPPGYFFCFVARDANSPTDNLFVSAPDAARLSRPPENGQPSRSAESCVWLPLGSKTEDIGLSIPYAAPSSSPLGYGNDLAVQFDKPIPEIAILTNTGIHIVKRRRLVDIFTALIRQGGGSEGFQNEINAMIRGYGRTETLATALAVACGQGLDAGQDARAARINDPEVLDAARKVFIEYGGKPSINQNSISDRSMPAIDAVRPSPRHAATGLYISRLLRSTWRNTIAFESRTPAGYSILPAVSLDKLRSIQEDMSALHRFFTTNKSFIKGLSGPDDLNRASSKDDEISLQGEHRALHSLVKFVSDTIEGISFVLVLFDERVAEIVALLPEALRPEFLKLTFEELFSTKKGFNMAKELVKAIVNRNIAKGSNVETVAEALRRRCGSFCSADDVIIFKAQEQLKRAAEAGNNVEYARNLLNESLRLFEQVAHNLPHEYLQSAVNQYIQQEFFAGAIQLILKVANELDKANEALSWMADGRPESDARKMKFEARTQCYNLVHDVVMVVDKSNDSGPSFVDGRPTLTAVRRNEAYDVIGRSKDEVFLTNLYDWYLEQGWHDRLLATDSAFIVTYLQRKSADDILHANLLWRYYGQTSQFYDAARIQLQLAKSGFNLSLDKRIEYLSRARANASTYTQGGSRKLKQQVLQEISELLDVANIQHEILQRLKDETRLPEERRDEIFGQVDGPILDITTLFNNFADNAGYYDICLMIYQVADHRDASQIKQTWQQLLQSIHDRTVASGEALPFEAIAESVLNLGPKLRMSESTFPVHILLPILEKYSFEHQRNIAPSHWVVEMFIDLEIAYEQLFDVLETMFYSNDPPFSGSNRKYIANDLAYVVQRWFQDSSRIKAGGDSGSGGGFVSGGIIFGSEQAASRVDELMQSLLRFGGPPQGGLDDGVLQTCRAIRERIAMVLG